MSSRIISELFNNQPVCLNRFSKPGCYREIVYLATLTKRTNGASFLLHLSRD